MQALTADEVRASFANCSRTRARRLAVPAGVEGAYRADAVLIGWRDQRAPREAYLLAEHEGRPVGVLLRATGSGPRRGSGLCDLCHAARPAGEVVLLVARRAGPAGRRDDTVGLYACADLTCDLAARGLTQPVLPQPERPGPARVEGLRRRLAAFLERVLGDGALRATG
ncbi:FBP domain-containing protein [Vallicoccus soli]|uniref:FBP domain-containing protein n=1 Tax=Vallicoccus soli TaxID=2339232 RepID=A0A3A3ZK03_9ACTN|nr:FBP domain-containing protein [Vallicoccus soli]RJK96009.1 FBP domain-containing protein [Vallicoccus soli]